MTTNSPAAQPSSTPILRKVLVMGLVLGLVITAVGAIVGYLVAGTQGLAGGLIGGVMAIVFPGLTALSILIANRFVSSPIYTALFFAVVLGTWLVKFVVFIVVMILLRGQDWLDPIVLFVTIVCSVLASLVVDVVVVARSRLPYASDVVLPGEQMNSTDGSTDSSTGGKS